MGRLILNENAMNKNERLFNRMATTAMAMVAYGHDESPRPYKPNNRVSKGEAKKCKSCKHFERCKVPPMKLACDSYERRKKK